MRLSRLYRFWWPMLGMLSPVRNPSRSRALSVGYICIDQWYSDRDLLLTSSLNGNRIRLRVKLKNCPVEALPQLNH